jgi:hypothetical protein
MTNPVLKNEVKYPVYDAISMYKIFNRKDSKTDWVDLNFQIRIKNRHDNLEITRSNNYVIGRKCVVKRL